MNKLPLVQSARMIVIILLITVILFVSLSGILFLSTKIMLQADIVQQRDYLDEIKQNAPLSINEHTFSSIYPNQNLKINQIQVLATHNSYKKKMPSIYYSLGNLSTKFRDLIETNYAHNTLTHQLNNGIRGLELDIRYQFNKFQIYHAPIFDNRTHNPLFKETLEELLLWSQRNPNHFMVNIIIELKDDPLFLNPSNKKIDAEILEQLDRTINYTLGSNKLITPDTLKNGYDDLQSMVSNNAWLPAHRTKGKFMFLLHYHNEYTDKYIALDSSLSTQTMVPLIESQYIDDYKPYSAILLHNTPEVEVIQQLVTNNYMVRTRMDINSIYNEQRKKDALSSGAQIITTDLEKGRLLPKGDYNAYLEEEYTIRANPLNT